MKKFWFLFVEGYPATISASEAEAQAENDVRLEDGPCHTKTAQLTKPELATIVRLFFPHNRDAWIDHLWERA